MLRLSVLLLIVFFTFSDAASCGEKLPFASADWYGGSLSLNHLGACSGNGICNNVTGLCECDAGWTGLSDLINTDGIDCHINNLAIQIEWGFVCALACLFMFQTRDSVVDRIRLHSEMRAQRLAQGKGYTIWKNNRTLLAMILYSFGCFPSILILGILRIAKEDERAGVTFGYSLLFFTGKFTFYSAALIFQPALLGSLLSGGKGNATKVKRMIQLGYGSQYITFTLSMIAAVAPLIIIADTEKGVTDLAQIVYVVYFILQAISLAILFTVSFIIKKEAKIIFDQSYDLTKDERTKSLQQKVNALEKKALISSFVIGVIYLAYVIFPTLWNKHDYVFPLTWLPFVVIGKEINNQHIKTHGTRSGSRSGGSSHGSSNEPPTRSNMTNVGTSIRTMFRFGKSGKNQNESKNYIVPGGEKRTQVYSKGSKSEEDDGYV